MGNLKHEDVGNIMVTETTRQNDNDSGVSQGQTENRATLALEGMTCASCAMRIEKGLKKLPGVKDASVNFATEQATVTYDPAQTEVEQMVQKGDAVGYKAIPLVMPAPKLTPIEPETESQVTLDLEGMTCASCAMRIEKGLKKVPGVKDASVNFATEQASVTYDPAQTGPEQLIQKVEAVGYTAFPQVSAPHTPVRGETSSGVSAPTGIPVVGVSQEDEQSRRKQADIRRKRDLLILGIILTLPVVILSMFFLNRFPGENYLLLPLTTPVWAIVGWEVHRGAIKRLRHGGANMETLISVGSSAAYGMSVVATFFPHVVGSVTFYDTTALIVTLIFLGKYLEARAKGQ